MQFIILAYVICTLTLGYLAKIHILPKAATYIPELASLIAVGYVVTVGAGQRFAFVRPIYWVLLGFFVLVILCGVGVNILDPGPLFVGLRTYLRTIPLFLLPAVFLITEKQLWRMFRAIIVLAIVQLPLAYHQRMSKFTATYSSGDLTVGTLMNSAFLSIFEIGVACVLTGLFMRRRLPLLRYLLLMALVLAPTMLNETKGTLILLPAGLMTVFVLGSSRGVRLRNAALSVGILTAFIAIYIPVYDYFRPHQLGVVEFFAGDHAESYVDKGAQVGSREPAGRIDSLRVAFQALSRDPSQFAFGLGVGNVSPSSLGPEFAGRYFPVYGIFAQSTATNLLFDTGVLGLLTMMLLYFSIFTDARVTAKAGDFEGAVALGWTGVVVVMTGAMLYKNTIPSDALSGLFWLFSGIICAHRMRLTVAARRQSQDPERLGSSRSVRT